MKEGSLRVIFVVLAVLMFPVSTVLASTILEQPVYDTQGTPDNYLLYKQTLGTGLTGSVRAATFYVQPAAINGAYNVDFAVLSECDQAQMDVGCSYPIYSEYHKLIEGGPPGFESFDFDTPHVLDPTKYYAIEVSSPGGTPYGGFPPYQTHIYGSSAPYNNQPCIVCQNLGSIYFRLDDTRSSEDRVAEQADASVTIAQNGIGYPTQTFVPMHSGTIRSIAVAGRACSINVSDGAFAYATFDFPWPIPGGYRYTGGAFSVVAGNTYYLTFTCYDNIYDGFQGTATDSYSGGQAGHSQMSAGVGGHDFVSNATAGNLLADWAFTVCTTNNCQLAPSAPPPPVHCIPGTDPACNDNVMFLPGMEASYLYSSNQDGTGENQRWLPDDSLGTGDLDALAMGNTSTANDTYAKDGHILNKAYNISNMYMSLSEQLDAMATRTGTTTSLINEWKPIAYDWRLDYQDLLSHGAQTGDRIYYRGLRAATSTPYIVQELKRLAATSRTGKVTIIAHSNGGLLAKALLSHPEYAQYVDKVILVASPQVGTPAAIGGLLHGYKQGIPFDWLSPFASPAGMRATSQGMPVAYNLLPSDAYMTQPGIQPVVTFDPATMSDWIQRYGTDSVSSTAILNAFMSDPLRPKPAYGDVATPGIASSTMILAAAAEHASTTLDSWVPPAGVQVFMIGGWGDETLQSIRYERLPYFQCVVSASTPGFLEARDCSLTTKIAYTPVKNLDGDGTVAISSALWNGGAEQVQKYWVDLDAYNGELPKSGLLSNYRIAHTSVFEVPALRELLASIIQHGSAASIPAKYISANALSSSVARTHFIVHSPVTLGFIDASGNYTGSTATTTVFNIPGADYERVGEVQYLSVPKDIRGNVVMRGTGTGSFVLEIEEAVGNAITATTTFAAPAATSTIATLNVDPSTSSAASSTLVIDYDGNGTADVSLHAKTGDTVLPKHPLTATADNKTMILHGTIPPLTATISGFVNGDTATSSTAGAPVCTTTATASSTPGTYPITCTIGSLSSDHYTFTTFTAGTLTIQYRCGFGEPINDHGHEAKHQRGGDDRDESGANSSFFKAGSTIPVKLTLLDVQGIVQQATASPSWLTPVRGGPIAKPIDESVFSAPATVVSSYARDDEEWRYTWRTKGLTAGYWYRVYAKLGNGQLCSVAVGLR